jgi:hypothetical protein
VVVVAAGFWPPVLSDVPAPSVEADWPEPVPVPVRVVAPVPPEICSPTVRSTEVTVPSKVATS